MHAIVLKDLFENSRSWVVFAAMTLAALIAAGQSDLPSGRLELVAGFLQGTILASSLLFTHSSVVNERRRRHLILLKSFPLQDWQILSSKYLAIAILSFSLLNIPYCVEPLVQAAVPLTPWLETNLMLFTYSTVLFFCSVCFRSLFFLFVPLYLSLGVLFISPDLSELRFITGLNRQHSIWALSSAAVVVSVSALLLSLKIFQRREIDF